MDSNNFSRQLGCKLRRARLNCSLSLEQVRKNPLVAGQRRAWTTAALADLGIDYAEVTDELEAQGPGQVRGKLGRTQRRRPRRDQQSHQRLDGVTEGLQS
jgi:hypothetical protein